MKGVHRLTRLALATAVVTVALMAVLAATAHPAAACSCVAPTDQQAAAEADAVVIGSRVEREFDLYDPQMLIQVEQVLKGEVSAQQGVLGAGYGCRTDVEADARSLIFLDRDDAGRLRLMPCAPTRAVSASTDDLVAALGGDPPAPGSVIYAVGGPQGRGPVLVVLVAVLVLAGVLALIGRGLDRRAGRREVSAPGGRPAP